MLMVKLNKIHNLISYCS